ncbi:DUF559 domain-containing protein [Zhihengliuella sp.]|uniref:endonuclease domain-containing protein n=1 Tax=Zhihengliuella sp. TaxID=1954483 RepID=UPI0028122CFD|nr:DUF559 domain-containing protein [Zhihengliuella sp.]
MDISELLGRHGVLTRCDLAEFGLSRRQLDRVFALYPNPRPGVICDPLLGPQAQEALRLTAALTCISAAEHYDHWVLRPSGTVHVATAHSHALRPSPLRIVRHRVRRAALVAVDEQQMCLHAAACLEPTDAAVIIESAVVRGRVSLDGLYAGLGNRQGRQARRALGLVRGTADSPIEVVARATFIEAGLPFQEQVYLPGIGRVDFLVAGRLIVELDGWQWHGNRAAWQNDMRRDQFAVRSGYRSVRFSASQVLNQPDFMLDTVREALFRGANEHRSPF